MIFLLFSQPSFIYEIALLIPSKGLFFFLLSHLTVYYGFISLEMGAAGSLINGLKNCFCQNQRNKTQIPTKPSVFVFLKQALSPSELH